ncbi:hypothetical protein ACFP3I_11155 [Chryseobacterium arachidis]
MTTDHSIFVIVLIAILALTQNSFVIGWFILEKSYFCSTIK